VLRHVTAPDGVRIACEVSGDGPPLVLVHGAGSARWSFDEVRPSLEPRFTVIAIDRRGRGDSTDNGGDGYALESEVEDVAAVARDVGEGALLFGHSYGGLIAGEAARRLDLPRLALYEPCMGGVVATSERIDRWERMIEAGERDMVVRELSRDVTGYDDAEIDEMVGSAVWEARKRVVHTVPRELRAELAHRFDGAALAELAMPTLLLVGTESPGWAIRSVGAYVDAIPGSERSVLGGHGHGANLTAPGLLAAELGRFMAAA
jgi:pimeloyl-ACP methyl ester carboxylesterase